MKEFAKKLKWERERHSWSQEQTAEMIGTTTPNVSRWERGITFPGPYFRQKLCELFGKSAEALGFVEEERDDVSELLPDSPHVDLPVLSSSPNPSIPRWNIPYRRNPFFTGREEVLLRLHDSLQADNSAVLAQVQAISGLGGIGKTSTAIEYAHRHREEYQIIIWADAETRDTLISDFVMMANVLNLFEKDDQDWRRSIEAVKRYLNNQEHWLLILDNVEDLLAIEDFLPHESKGHVIMTTCSQSTGAIAQRIDLERMEPDEGALFLLRRAKLLAPHTSLEEAQEAHRTMAKAIAQIMDGLPLALDQAGAYIEETACSLSDYLDRYHTQSTLLLDIRGSGSGHHPHSVSATVSLSFERIMQSNPAAAELLELCAFLHPDAIPEEILVEGAIDLGPILAPAASDPLKRDAAIAALRKYSLLRRNPETKMLTMHRLVQAVLKDRMDEEKQYLWAERTVQAVNRTFPDVKDDLAIWLRCQRCILHGQACIGLIEQWKIASPAAARLLNQAGAYLRECGQYTQAETVLRKALDIAMPTLGPEHPDVAQNLHNLALLYLDQGRYVSAEPLLQQAMAIREKVLGVTKPELVLNLNDLGVLYFFQGKFVQAELFYKRAQDMWEQMAGQENSPDSTLNNLGCLYLYQGKYAQAESLLTESLAVFDETIGPDHPERAYELDNLARLYRDRGEYSRAESLFAQAFAMREQHLGPEHPLVAETLNDWARLCYYQGKYLQGERFCHRAIAIWKQTVGMEHPRIAQVFHNLAMLSHIQDKSTQAETFAERALAVREQTLGSDHPKVAQTLTVLGDVYCKQANYVQAEAMYLRALKIFKQAIGQENPRVACVLASMVMLYLAQKKYIQAEDFCLKALAIREKVLGGKHPDVAQSLYHLARIYHDQVQYDQAEQYYQQALDMQEQILGPEHLALAITLEQYSALLITTRRESEARSLAERAREISVKHAKENTQELKISQEDTQNEGSLI
jgi:tetratricopeptide (TPR) repeat protein/transcriptional regulator with XRE-family HTH domain